MTLQQKIFEKIFNLILSGELPLGATVNEASLAERFGVSRGPIREAVQKLGGLRLVTREPQMRARVVSLSYKDIIEIYQLREAVEGMACRLFAQNPDEALLNSMLEDIERARAGANREIDFHATIARGCGNVRIATLLNEDLYYLLKIYRARSGAKPGRTGKALEEHWQILRALENRDGQLAESLMRTHIARAADNLLSAESVFSAISRADNEEN